MFRTLAYFEAGALLHRNRSRHNKKFDPRISRFHHPAQRDSPLAASQAPSGGQTFMQLLSYIFWVCGEGRHDEFREKIRNQLPEAEDTVMKIAEKLIEQGRNEGRSELLEKQLALKFGTLSPAHQARLTSATIEQLDRFAARVLFADSLEAVFAE